MSVTYLSRTYPQGREQGAPGTNLEITGRSYLVFPSVSVSIFKTLKMIFSDHLRPKIASAINTLRDRTCLTFQEVASSYKGDYIKMYRGKG